MPRQCAGLFYIPQASLYQPKVPWTAVAAAPIVVLNNHLNNTATMPEPMADKIKLYPSRPDKVYFYGTCLIDLFYPDAGMAGIQLLEREGIEVVFPQDQTCCGQPAYTSGYHDEARAVAEAQLGLFPDNYPIVMPSGSCAGMMRRHYPDLFRDTPQVSTAGGIAERVWELTDFLLNVCHIRLVDLGEPVRVAMHTSCSARRELGLAEVGPRLLAQLENVEVVTQERAEECCGFGGTFAVRHADIAGAMVGDKVETLVEIGAREYVTTDCGCLMNINGYAEKNLRPVQGQHILSFLWHRTGGAS